ncbi:MAG: glycosyltransferase family 39 protein [Verrucomicrobia bacterium]|nr:glycosyltransferase family 39 protein [Verrucomicrobiota bacterium]
MPRRVIVFLALVTFFRLWFCTQLELVGDEAYYWLWSKHLDYGYFSKGPGVAWTIAAGTWLFGDTVFGIRFFAVILAAATGVLLYVQARSLFSEAVAWAGLLLACTIPLFAVGSILMTIDPLSVFFWALAAVLFWRAKDEDRAAGWILTGAAVGLGSLCKYTNLAEIGSFALFCVWSRDYRRHFRCFTFASMVLVAVAVLTPVLIWNYQHGWITAQHLAHRGSLDRAWRFSLGEFSQFAGQQAGVISPLVFAGILISSISVKAPEDRPLEHRFLQTLFWPLFALYTVLSFNDSGQPNWTAPCYVAGVILGASHWVRRVREKKWARNLAAVAVALALIETVVLHDTFWLNLPPRRDPLSRVRGSEDLARQVAALQAQFGAQLIIANKYAYASLLAFYHPQRPQTFLPHSGRMENQFSFWPGYREKFARQSAIFVSDSEEIPAQLQAEFAAVERVKTTESMYRGRPIKKFYLSLCRELRTSPEDGR